jgi:hypothetical protein
MASRSSISLAAVVVLGLSWMPAFSQTPSQTLGIMDVNELHRIEMGGGPNSDGVTGVLLDLNFMRLDRTSLDDPEFLKYFIALNNCGNPQIDKQFEFDFPKMAPFYRDKASKILDIIPTTIRLQLPMPILGEYDQVRHAFPILNDGRGVTAASRRQLYPLMIDHVDPAPDRWALSACRPAESMDSHNPVYQIQFKALQFSEIPMDEVTARNFVLHSPQGSRRVRLVLDIDILPRTPTVFTHSGMPKGVVFAGEVRKLTVFGPEENRRVSLGTGVITQEAPEQLSVLYP